MRAQVKTLTKITGGDCRATEMSAPGERCLQGIQAGRDG